MGELAAIVARLGPLARRALQTACERAAAAGQTTVRPEHVLVALLAEPTSDVVRLIDRLGLERARIERELQTALRRLPIEPGETVRLHPDLVDAIGRGWRIASLDHGASMLRTGWWLQASLELEATRSALEAAVPSLAQADRSRLRAALAQLVAEVSEGGVPAAGAATCGALDAYTTDLTAAAEAGRLDPVVGRDALLRLVVDVLLRRRQNNPLLAGDAGVGKTAIVEGLAQRIALGAVPAALRDVRLRALDLGALQAGAGARGELEGRLHDLLSTVAARHRRVVLFLDEAHMLTALGGAVADLASLLKPALARGDLRLIAATTWVEYQRSIAKDPALARRFEVIRVAEPDDDAATAMLDALVPALQGHHGVRIRADAVHAAVTLSRRYLTGRQLPDKAVGLLDTAAARVAAARFEPPAELVRLAERMRATEAALARAETDLPPAPPHRLEELRDTLGEAQHANDQLSGRWVAERDTVAAIDCLAAALVAAPAGERGELEERLRGLRLELDVLQDCGRLVPLEVDPPAVAEVVARWSGMPAGVLDTDAVATMLRLEDRLGARILGQSEALGALGRRLRTAAAGLAGAGRPTGAFLLAGPGGVGKTATAAALAEVLFGGPQALITVRLSEYREAHSVAGLKGAPPGYVGYGRGGLLTEAVRRRPFSVVLFDGIEFAHADVLGVLVDVLDRGLLEDGEGQVADFTNTVVLLTTRVGDEAMLRLPKEGVVSAATDALAGPLGAAFPDALLARVVVLPYRRLDPPTLVAVGRTMLAGLQARFGASYGVDLTYAAELPAALAAATTPAAGARAVAARLDDEVAPALAARLLDRLAAGQQIASAHLGLDAGGAVAVELRP